MKPQLATAISSYAVTVTDAAAYRAVPSDDTLVHGPLVLVLYIQTAAVPVVPKTLVCPPITSMAPSSACTVAHCTP